MVPGIRLVGRNGYPDVWLTFGNFPLLLLSHSFSMCHLASIKSNKIDESHCNYTRVTCLIEFKIGNLIHQHGTTKERHVTWTYTPPIWSVNCRTHMPCYTEWFTTVRIVSLQVLYSRFVRRYNDCAGCVRCSVILWPVHTSLCFDNWSQGNR